jgi:hypothetical protein
LPKGCGLRLWQGLAAAGDDGRISLISYASFTGGALRLVCDTAAIRQIKTLPIYWMAPCAFSKFNYGWFHDFPRPKQSGSNPHNRRTFFDGDFEIAAHAHA